MALYRINQFAARHSDKGMSPGGLRWQIFNEKHNGLAESGAIVRKGRTVWINEDRYFEWMGDEGSISPDNRVVRHEN